MTCLGHGVIACPFWGEGSLYYLFATWGRCVHVCPYWGLGHCVSLLGPGSLCVPIGAWVIVCPYWGLGHCVSLLGPGSLCVPIWAWVIVCPIWAMESSVPCIRAAMCVHYNHAKCTPSLPHSLLPHTLTPSLPHSLLPHSLLPQSSSYTMDTQFLITALTPYTAYQATVFAFNQYTVAFNSSFYNNTTGDVLSPQPSSFTTINTTEGGRAVRLCDPFLIDQLFYFLFFFYFFLTRIIL